MFDLIYKTLIYALLFLLICLTGFVLHDPLDDSALAVAMCVAQIITGGAVLFAALAYYHQKELADIKFALENVAFFNDVLIPSYDKLVIHLANGGKIDYDDMKIRTIRDFNFRILKQTHRARVAKQIKLLAASYNRTETETMLLFNKFANNLEQFAIRVKNTRTIGTDSLRGSKEAYVDMVGSTIAMLTSLDITSNDDGDHIRSLYLDWEPRLSRLKDDISRERAGEWADLLTD